MAAEAAASPAMTIEFPPTPENRYELIWLLERHWRSLDALIAGLREAEIVAPLDDWSVKDHVSHLAAWQGKALAVLQGLPAHEGLGLSAELYESLDTDGINSVLHETWRTIPVVEAIAALHHGHARVAASLQSIPWAELEAPVGGPDGRSVLEVVAANTYEHYIEHETWIRQQLAARQG